MLIALALYYVLMAYSWILFIYILLSWTPLVNSRFYNFLRNICEPYISVFRGRFIIGGMDMGVLIGLVLLNALVYLLAMLF